jgi:hypothetical protein
MGQQAPLGAGEGLGHAWAGTLGNPELVLGTPGLQLELGAETGYVVMLTCAAGVPGASAAAAAAATVVCPRGCWFGQCTAWDSEAGVGRLPDPHCASPALAPLAAQQHRQLKPWTPEECAGCWAPGSSSITLAAAAAGGPAVEGLLGWHVTQSPQLCSPGDVSTCWDEPYGVKCSSSSRHSSSGSRRRTGSWYSQYIAAVEYECGVA